MDMIERVTKAIFDEMDLMDGLDMPSAQRYARAAIEAMREPTEAMLKASDSIMGGGFQNSHSDAETWDAMIDAALTIPSTNK